MSTTAAVGGTFASFRVPAFRRYWPGLMTCQVGNWARVVAQTLLVLERTDNGLAVGLLTACQYLPIAVLGLWSGVLADRGDKVLLLVRMQVAAMTVSWALVAFAATGDDAPLVVLYILALLGGVASAIDQPARRSLVVEIVPAAYVGNAASLNTTAITSSQVIGPAVAGVLVATVGYTWCFAFDALSYLPFIVALRSISDADSHRPSIVARGGRQIREGLRYIREVPSLWSALLMTTVVGTFAFNFHVVVPLLITRSLGGQSSDYAVVFSILSVGSVAGALFVARFHAVELRFVVAMCLACGVALLTMSIVPSMAFVPPAAFAVGFASMGYWACVTAFIQLRVSGEMRGRVIALQGVLSLGGTPVGAPILGAVSDAFGGRAGWVLGGVACLLAGALGVRSAREQP